MRTDEHPRRRARARPQWTGNGVLALGVATLLSVTGVALLGAGAPALWVDQVQRDDEGFVTTDDRELSTPTAAVVVTPLEVALDRPVDEFLLERTLGELRVRVSGRSGSALFVGLGPAEAVEDYLDDVPVDRVRELVAGTPVDYDRREGSSRPRPPAQQDLWIASVQGTGALDLAWTVRDGRWALVVMHPDGSPGVRAELAVGATLPSLTWVASVVVVLGALFLGGGVVLLVSLALPDRPSSSPASEQLPLARGRVPSPRARPGGRVRS